MVSEMLGGIRPPAEANSDQVLEWIRDETMFLFGTNDKASRLHVQCVLALIVTVADEGYYG